MFHEENAIKRLDHWFIAQEIEMMNEEKYQTLPPCIQRAKNLYDIISQIHLNVSPNQILVGTQRDAFAMSYALINPAFTVESFSGYCDPTAVFKDIEPNEEFSKDRIEKVRNWFAKTAYATSLKNTYEPVEKYTKEVAFFVEQVTGHTICDFDLAYDKGVQHIISLLNTKLKDYTYNQEQKRQF